MERIVIGYPHFPFTFGINFVFHFRLCVETKMKGKGEVAFGEVTGRVSGVERGRAREGVALLLSEWMENKVVEWKEVSSRLMWVRVRMGRECWVFVSAYGPGCERSEEERDEFWNDLTRCVDGLTTRRIENWE